eukprot:scaffold571524_cov47-Prasinocladus_malaysianus.AAC.1
MQARNSALRKIECDEESAFFVLSTPQVLLVTAPSTPRACAATHNANRIRRKSNENNNCSTSQPACQRPGRTHSTVSFTARR